MNASIVGFVHAMPVVHTFNGSRRVFGETKEAVDDAARYEAQWGREFLPMFAAFFVLVSPALTIIPLGLLLWHLGRSTRQPCCSSSSLDSDSPCPCCACCW